MSDNEETVELSLDRYNELIDTEYLANSLFIAGVDNWEGYDEAIRVYNQFQSGEAEAQKVSDIDRDSLGTFRDYALKVEGVDLSNPAEADAVFTAAKDNGNGEGRNLLSELYTFFKQTGSDRLGLSESELELWEKHVSQGD
jgi:hypothetical protein